MGKVLAAVASFAAIVTAYGGAHAQSTDDVQGRAGSFYAGKVLRLLVGYGPGTGFDVYGRAVARHLGRNIPGNPTIVVENMPGAGGLTMANHLYNAAPKDGSAIGLLVNVFLEPLFKNELARYDPKQFNWIGSVSRSTPLCFTWHTAALKSLEDVKTRETLVGAVGRYSDSYYFPQIINSVLGTKFKPVLGYPDSGAIGLAMERGELHGFCSFSLSSIKSARPEWLDDKRIDLLVQLGMQKSPELPHVPLMLDLATDNSWRQALTVLAGNWEAARPMGAPPGVPSERMAALRTAFDRTMVDSAFLEEARKMKLEVDPIDGAAVKKIIDELYATPAAVVEKLIAIRAMD